MRTLFVFTSPHESCSYLPAETSSLRYEIAGALTHAAIGEADLLAGRWDGARVRLFAVDWTAAPTGSGQAERVELGEGRLGAVSLMAGRFTAELKGASAALARPVGRF